MHRSGHFISVSLTLALTLSPDLSQGTVCSVEHARYITSRGGSIFYLGKDIGEQVGTTDSGDRGVTSTSQHSSHSPSTGAGNLLRKLLRRLGGNTAVGATSRRPIYVSFRLSAMSLGACPGATGAGALGFSAEEAMDLCRVAGMDRNVS